MEFLPLPVHDARVRKWRVIILVMDNGKVSALLPVDAFKSEQEATTAGYALMTVMLKKAQQTP